LNTLSSRVVAVVEVQEAQVHLAAVAVLADFVLVLDSL
jgi:hypothetical protein